MHGKSFIIEKKLIDDRITYEYKGKLKEVFDFLLEKRVIERDKPGVLTSQIADFFWNLSKDFVLILAKKLRNNANEIVIQMLSDALIDSANNKIH